MKTLRKTTLKKNIFLAFCIMTFSVSVAQVKTLTIDLCQQKARDNFPLIKKFELLEASKDYTLSNISKAYLPQVSFKAQATYQSAVTGLPLKIPGIDVPTLSKDQYKTSLDMSQLIWNGGQTSAQRNISKASNEVEKQRLEVILYSIREQVNQLYFGILSISEQTRQLEIIASDLLSSFNTVNALVVSGNAMSSDRDMVKVEMLNIAQKQTELQSMKIAYIQMLAAMINESIASDDAFEKPAETTISLDQNILRPELQLYATQGKLLNTQNSTIESKNMPQLALFAQGGYGKPGLNMLANEFDFFAIAGLRMSWNFGNLYSKKNDKSLIKNNQHILNLEEETFRYKTNLKVLQAQNEVFANKKLLSQDDEIITLRSNIKQAAQSKHRNGIYTTNDLIKDINAESQAKQTKALHEINYLMSIYQHNFIVGK
ncbi:transporter [Bacteroidales bacterium]|nr:transporter [Bacteroidales bacterium]